MLLCSIAPSDKIINDITVPQTLHNLLITSQIESLYKDIEYQRRDLAEIPHEFQVSPIVVYSPEGHHDGSSALA